MAQTEMPSDTHSSSGSSCSSAGPSSSIRQHPGRAGLSIAGRVVDDRGVALGSFSVRAEPVHVEGDQRPHARRESFEAVEGRFVLRGLAAGSWTLGLEAEGHSRVGAIPIRVPGDDAELRFVLPRESMVTGRAPACLTPERAGSIRI